MHRRYASLYERLIANSAEPESATGCWPWLARCDRWGYGLVNLRIDGAHLTLKAHVVNCQRRCARRPARVFTYA